MPSLNYENFAENLKMPCLKFLLTVKYCCCLTLVTQIDPLHCCFPSILYLCPTVVKTVKLPSLRCLALYYTPLHDAVISRKQSILDDYMYFYLNMKCYMLLSFLLSCSLISMLMSYCTCYIWVTVCGLCVDPLLCPTPRCDPIQSPLRTLIWSGSCPLRAAANFFSSGLLSLSVMLCLK